jgi:hypothetical protein
MSSTKHLLCDEPVHTLRFLKVPWWFRVRSKKFRHVSVFNHLWVETVPMATGFLSHILHLVLQQWANAKLAKLRRSLLASLLSPKGAGWLTAETGDCNAFHLY